jgi:hypothetical protein
MTPTATHRVDASLLEQCRSQMDSRQIAAHEEAGELPTCCQHHGFDEGDCNGRNCPAGRIDLAAAWRYVCAYVPLYVQYRDHAAAKRAGHLAAITKPQEPDGIVLAGREPMSGEAKVLIAAVTVTWLTVMALSIQDLPERIVSLWPAIVALASF